MKYIYYEMYDSSSSPLRNIHSSNSTAQRIGHSGKTRNLEHLSDSFRCDTPGVGLPRDSCTE